MDITKEYILEEFNKIFGESKETIRVFAAPGRVNLIGEHIDYCGGYVFPAALTLETIVVTRSNDTTLLRMAASDLDGIYTVDLNDIDAGKELKWGNYQAGTAKELIKAGYDIKGTDMLYICNVPFGSGLSSSASIEISTAYALASLYGNKDISLEDKVNLALYGQKAENNYCGVNCGIMDQFASAMGKKGYAMLLNCSNLQYEYVPLDLNYNGDEYLIVLGNTCKKHALGASKYNERRAEVSEGLEIMNELYKDSPRDNLCDYTAEEFDAVEDRFENETIKKRVKHVIYENQRVIRSVNVLKKGDLKEFGELLCIANDSIRDLYEATGFELDSMHTAALAHPHCIGARMTGGGFGGCTVNIVKKDSVADFIEKTGEIYKKLTSITPQFYVCSIGDGAREIIL